MNEKWNVRVQSNVQRLFAKHICSPSWKEDETRYLKVEHEKNKMNKLIDIC